ncbi:AlpA family phage regulatory protein [Microvirga sp. HBU67558]|uniref:helix-turn-helix transcriptional regulator n=1 Tax=Microvirga TaxID=186650 RepID=UPI001B35FE07|nr:MULTISPECIES: AlpA family phage regulatory protein [unclassified Microvirga]MBQ0820602.1 AlpA family phage regulatory protein [Microvirga sp. HBU67558]
MINNLPSPSWHPRPPAEADLGDEGYYRLNAIIGSKGLLPISRSTWYSWIQQGKAPPPVSLGPRIAAWRKSDIRKLLQSLDPKQAQS